MFVEIFGENTGKKKTLQVKEHQWSQYDCTVSTHSPEDKCHRTHKEQMVSDEKMGNRKKKKKKSGSATPSPVTQPFVS